MDKGIGQVNLIEVLLESAPSDILRFITQAVDKLADGFDNSAEKKIAQRLQATLKFQRGDNLEELAKEKSMLASQFNTVERLLKAVVLSQDEVLVSKEALEESRAVTLHMAKLDDEIRLTTQVMNAKLWGEIQKARGEKPYEPERKYLAKLEYSGNVYYIRAPGRTRRIMVPETGQLEDIFIPEIIVHDASAQLALKKFNEIWTKEPRLGGTGSLYGLEPHQIEGWE